MTVKLKGSIPKPANDLVVLLGDGHTIVRDGDRAISLDPQVAVPSAVPDAHADTHKNAGSDELLLHEFGEPTASVQFAQQQALQFRIENRTSDPSSPATGEIWLRTDL